ncbi:MAG: hypothetical protein IJ689_07760 [Alphaproteobacteria bacterium]|nr:hypothetical protein [Alphaproteobacteria bacterium]MBR1649471.1 hypothetical protein [Alphaproteobacteria bacterium]
MKRFIAILTCVGFIWGMGVSSAQATQKLPPADFNDMYSTAARGDLGSLLAASHRGLDLNAPNKEGDAGICVAIKRGDYMAYNTFIKAGAMQHPRCVNFLAQSEYNSFVSSPRAVKYSQYPTSFKPRESSDWLTAGGVLALIAGLAWVVTSSSGN